MNQRCWWELGFLMVVALVAAAACGNTKKNGDCNASGTCAPASNAGADNAGGADSGSSGIPVHEAGGAGGEPNRGPVDAPPRVVAVTPNDHAAEVPLETTVVIEFSEPLAQDTVTSTSIQLLDGTTAIPGELSYAGSQVTFTPSAPLALFVTYTVSVTTEITDESGVHLASPHTSDFTTRDGVWHTNDAVKSGVWQLSHALPISSTGQVLLAWSGSIQAGCAISARSFLRASAITPVETRLGGETGCGYVSAGGNAAGVTAVSWSESGVAHGSYALQNRGSAWQVEPSLVAPLAGDDPNNLFGSSGVVVVSPNGVSTLFETTGDYPSQTKSWSTNTEGQWPASPQPLSSFLGGPSGAVFDAKGNGLAVWVARDATTDLERIVASRFTPAAGKWSQAVELPGTFAKDKSVAGQRGVPALAFDDKGDALALWLNASADGTFMSNRFVQATGWAEPELVDPQLLAGGLSGQDLFAAPGLVFDGQAFVAAWSAQGDDQRYLYTARYELGKGWGKPQKQGLPDKPNGTRRMPLLTCDGHGSLLLVVGIQQGADVVLMYQRYARGRWSALESLPGGVIPYDDGFNDPLPLSMNANGEAALAWLRHDDLFSCANCGVKLASFY